MQELGELLLKNRKRNERKELKYGKKAWRADYFQPPPEAMFEHGVVDFSPGWFMQRLEVSQILLALFCRILRRFFLEASRSSYCFPRLSVGRGGQIYPEDISCRSHPKLHRDAYMPRFIFCRCKSHQKVETGRTTERTV